MTQAQQVWVLGGGGLGGIAWELGMLMGLADEGVSPSPDATLLGTSAGAAVAAQLAGGTPIAELYERQLGGVPWEVTRSMSPGALVRFLTAGVFSRSPEAMGRTLGQAALKRKNVGTPEERRAVIDGRLPVKEWTKADLRIATVDATTGAIRIITRADGIGLVDAVGASCAIPLVYPPVMLEGHPYVDGGIRTTANLDLAPGTGPVICLSPSSTALNRWGRLSEQRKRLGADRIVEIVEMGPEAKAAQGRNALDRTIVPGVAAAGRAQGRADAARIAAVLA